MVEEFELVFRIKDGDKKAFEQVFHQYYGVLCSLAKRYMKDSDMSEEMVCQVFFHLWENRSHLEVDSSLKNYLIRSVHNRCLNALRHQKVVQKHAEDFTLDDSAGVELETPHDFAQQSEIESIIKRVVDSLPEQCRRIFIMSREENLSHKEIADQLQVSVNTVKTQLSRGTNRLKEALKDYMCLFL